MDVLDKIGFYQTWQAVKSPKKLSCHGKIIELLSNFPGFPHSRALHKHEKNLISGALLSMFEAGNMPFLKRWQWPCPKGVMKITLFVCVFFLNRAYPPSIFRDMMNHRMP